MPVDIFAERILEAVLTSAKSPTMFEFGRRLFEKYAPHDAEQAGYEPEIKLDVADFSHDEVAIFARLFHRALKSEPPAEEPSPLGQMYDYHVEGEYRVWLRDDGHIRIERIAKPDDTKEVEFGQDEDG